MFHKIKNYKRFNLQIIFLGLLLILTLVVFYLNTAKQNKLISSVKAKYLQAAWQTSNTVINEGTIESPGHIIQVDLSYNEIDNPQITIDSVVVKNGAVSSNPLTKDNYRLVVYDKEDIIIYSVGFDINNQIFIDSIDLSKSGLKKLNNYEFVLTIPWFDNVMKLAVLDPNGEEISSKSFEETTVENNKVNFHMIDGDDFIKVDQNNLINLINLKNILPAKKVLASSGHVNVVFISDDSYEGNYVKFHNDINAGLRGLFLIEPFKSRSSEFRFFYIDSNQNLDCKNSDQGTGVSTYFCNSKSVYNVANNYGTPYNIIVVLVNSQMGGGVYNNNSMVVITNRTDFISQLLGINFQEGVVLAHEFGHAIGGLQDEYVYLNEQNLTHFKASKNCYSGTPPNFEWEGLVNHANYYKGCSLSNFYRPSDVSIMNRGYDSIIFNDISLKYMNEGIDTIANYKNSNVIIPTPSEQSNPSGQILLLDKFSCSDLPCTSTIAWSTKNVSSAVVCLGEKQIAFGTSGSIKDTQYSADHFYIVYDLKSDNCRNGIKLDSSTMTVLNPTPF